MWNANNGDEIPIGSVSNFYSGLQEARNKKNEPCQTINKKERWLEHLVIEENFIIRQDDINKSQFRQ